MFLLGHNSTFMGKVIDLVTLALWSRPTQVGKASMMFLPAHRPLLQLMRFCLTSFVSILSRPHTVAHAQTHTHIRIRHYITYIVLMLRSLIKIKRNQTRTYVRTHVLSIHPYVWRMNAPTYPHARTHAHATTTTLRITWNSFTWNRFTWNRNTWNTHVLPRGNDAVSYARSLHHNEGNINLPATEDFSCGLKFLFRFCSSNCLCARTQYTSKTRNDFYLVFPKGPFLRLFIVF